MSSETGTTAIQWPALAMSASYNQQLITSAGFTATGAEIIAMTPYVKGLGFSVKKRYPDLIAEKWLRNSATSDIFGFISVSIHLPSAESSDRRAVAFVEISAAYASSADVEGMVTPIRDIDPRLPLPVSETFYLNPDTLEGFLEGEAPTNAKTLRTVCDELWRNHLIATKRFGGALLRIQLQGYKALSKLPIVLVGLTEFLVWIFSGKSFQVLGETAEPPKKYSTKQWVFQSLSKTAVCVSYLSDQAPPKVSESEPLTAQIELYGLKISPVSGLWFYVTVLLFFGYRNLDVQVGEMEFLNAYWNAILFFAPVVVLGCAWCIPTLGRLLISWIVHRHFKNLFSGCNHFTVRKCLGFSYLRKSTERSVRRGDFIWD